MILIIANNSIQLGSKYCYLTLTLLNTIRSFEHSQIVPSIVM